MLLIAQRRSQRGDELPQRGIPVVLLPCRDYFLLFTVAYKRDKNEVIGIV